MNEMRLDEPGLLLVEAAAPDGRPETVWRRCKFVAAADARSCYVVDATGGGKEKLRPFSSLLPFDEALEGRYRSGVEPCSASSARSTGPTRSSPSSGSWRAFGSFKMPGRGGVSRRGTGVALAIGSACNW